MRDRRRAFIVNDMFEDELAAYTGAPYVVTTDSCTNALFLCFTWFHKDHSYVEIPKHTYVGVAQAARNAGYDIVWGDLPWRGWYWLNPLPLIDSAKSLHRNMYTNSTVCVSFQASKILPIGRGGAILTHNKELSVWARKARFDGRTEGDRCDTMTEFAQPGFHCYMTPPDAARGLWLLTYLDDNPQDQVDVYPDLSLVFK